MFFCKKEKYDEKYATVLEGLTREIEKIDKFNENSENRRGSCIEDERFIYEEAPLQSLSDSNNGRLSECSEGILYVDIADNTVIARIIFIYLEYLTHIFNHGGQNKILHISLRY